MVAVRKEIVPVEALPDRLVVLAEQYSSIKVYLRGSKRHREEGLEDLQALVVYWGRREGQRWAS